ncbi:MAG: Uma2 family endonuclease [Marmoricola sp.]
MTHESTLSTSAGPFTRADLDAMPDDGRRHELIDGVLVVTPAPAWRHQRILLNLTLALRAARPSGMTLLFAPFDVALAPDTVMEPDLLVGRTEDFTEKDLPTAPLLAVEVLSPSTRRFDLLVKKSRFEAAGCPSYWVVDPEGPRIVAWELRGERYEQVAEATGDEALEVDAPYPVRIFANDLLAE